MTEGDHRTHSPIFDELPAVQRRHGYLPKPELRASADRIDLPLYRLQSVASFYPHFFLAPPARVEVRVCGDMSCHRYAAGDLRATLERRFHGQDVNIQHVSCLGRCDLAPAIAVNDRIYERVSDFVIIEKKWPGTMKRLLTNPIPWQDHRTRFTERGTGIKATLEVAQG